MASDVDSDAMTDEIAELKETIESWARSVSEQDWTSFVRYWDDNAVLMPPGRPSIKGPANIEAFVRQDVGPVGDFAFSNWRFDCAGDLDVVTTDFDAGTVAGKHVIVLHRRRGASWAIKTVIYNSND